MRVINLEEALKIKTDRLFCKIHDKFEPIIDIDTVRLKYENIDNLHDRATINKDNIVEIGLFLKNEDIELYTDLLSLKDIPTNFKDLFNEGDKCSIEDSKFKKAMIRHDFIDDDNIDLPKLITEKAKNLNYYGIVEKLTGLEEDEIIKAEEEETKEKEVKLMKSIADKYGYTITKKD